MKTSGLSVCFCCALLMLFLYGGTAVAGVINVQGRWSKRDSMHGIPATASGPINFRIDKENGSFSCTVSGNGTMNGNAKVYGSTQHITASTRFNSTSCSGLFDVDSNSIGGNIVVRTSYTSRASFRDEDGKMQTYNDRGTINYTGPIRGSVAKPGSVGTIVSEGETINWRITAGGTQVALSNTDKEGYKQYVKDSVELTKTLAGEYKNYRNNGGGGSFEDFLKKMYPDPSTYSSVEQSIRVASIAKDNEDAADPQPTTETLTQEKLDEAYNTSEQVMDEFAKNVAAGGVKMEDLFGYLDTAYTDPAQKKTVVDSLMTTAMDGFFQAKENLDGILNSAKLKTSMVAAIKAKVSGMVQTGIMSKMTGALPKAFVNGAANLYGKLSNLTKSVTGYNSLNNTKKEWNKKNAELYRLHSEGKLGTDGVQAMQGLGVLGIALDQLPELGGYKKHVIQPTFGKAAKATKAILVYKTVVRKGTNGKLSGKNIDDHQESRDAIAKAFGPRPKGKPYNHKNLFYEFFKGCNRSVNPWAPKPKATAAQKKYH